MQDCSKDGGTKLIQVDEVRFQYKKRDIDGNVIANEEILKGINITIKKGEFIAVLGRNGSGKTTFSKQLNAILRPSEGIVTVDGMETKDKDKRYEIRQHVGMVFQNPDNQMVASNVEEEVAFGPENLGIEPGTIVSRVKQALEQVRMWKHKKIAPNHLSGGQKQRLAIAGILAMNPDYIVLDEPTAMLDPKGRSEVQEALKRLNREQKTTVILITHDMEEVALASRVILLSEGIVCFDGTPDMFFKEEALLAKLGMVAPLSYRVQKILKNTENRLQYADKSDEKYIIDSNNKFKKDEQTVEQKTQEYGDIQSDSYKKVGLSEIQIKNHNLFTLENVSYIYGPGTVHEKVALEDVSLSLNKGEIVGLAGHTGSGKSTLIQLLNGLLKPTRGTVSFCGKDIHEKGYSGKNLRDKVGMVFQYPEHQMICDTVWDDVSFGPERQNLSEEEKKSRVEDALRFVELPEKYYKASPLQLSGGQKRRVAIAGVLAMHPEYIILDEPAAGLDAEGKREIFGRFKKMCREQKIGVLLVSHSMDDLAEYADRIIVLEAGKKILDDCPSKVFAKHKILSACGLDVPETVKIAENLRERGYEIPHNIIREVQLLDTLAHGRQVKEKNTDVRVGHHADA